MDEIRTLLGLELRSLYGINKFRHTADPKEKNRFRGLMAAWAVFIGMVLLYVGALVWGLCALGLGSVVPAYLTVIASLLILAFGIFTAGNRIFGQQGYDLLASMPIRPCSIVISRFLAMYAEDLVLTLVVMLPGLGVYGFLQRPGLGFYLGALVGTVWIPAIPLVIATALGSLVLAVSSRMKGKSLVQTVLMLILVVGILAGSFSLEGVTLDAISDLAQTMGQLFSRVYPPAAWLGAALTQGSIGGLTLFVGVSLLVMVLAMALVSRYYAPISWRLQSDSASHDYKISAMESRGLLKALYLREAKGYFSSSVYVINTIIGPIMGLLLSAGLGIAGLDAIGGQLPGMDLGDLLPFVLAGVFCMMTTTSVSISMEGRQIWAVKSLPIPVKAWLDCKILLNLTLILPFYLVSLGVLAVTLTPGNLLWLALVPLSVILFSLVFGITVNLKFHNFDWDKAETVVKQSAAAAMGGFAGPLVSILLGLMWAVTPAGYQSLTLVLSCLVLLSLTAWLYQRNNKTELCKL